MCYICNAVQRSTAITDKNMNTTQRTTQEQIEAMIIICNIQTMQQKVYGKSFKYDDFNANTIEELRDLQDKLIKEYNNTFKA